MSAMKPSLAKVAGSWKIAMPRMAVPTAPMPVQAAYAVPTGSAFNEIPNRMKLDQAAAIVRAVKCHRVKPSDAFMLMAQMISRMPAANKINHA